MPQFTFRWSDQPASYTMELESLDQAWSEAVDSIGQALRDKDGHLPAPGCFGIQIFDEQAIRVASISIKAERSDRS